MKGRRRCATQDHGTPAVSNLAEDSRRRADAPLYEGFEAAQVVLYSLTDEGRRGGIHALLPIGSALRGENEQRALRAEAAYRRQRSVFQFALQQIARIGR